MVQYVVCGAHGGRKLPTLAFTPVSKEMLLNAHWADGREQLATKCPFWLFHEMTKWVAISKL